MMPIDRSCYEILDAFDYPVDYNTPHRISTLDAPTIVIIGPANSGKTRALKTLSKDKNIPMYTVSDYMKNSIDKISSLILDDLDEYLFNNEFSDHAIDDLISKLCQYTPKRLYIGMRSASYWHQRKDIAKLYKLGVEPKTYHLTDLSKAEARQILREEGLDDPQFLDSFLDKIYKLNHLDAYLHNPFFMTSLARSCQAKKTLPEQSMQIMANIYDHIIHANRDDGKSTASTAQWPSLQQMKDMAQTLCAVLVLNAKHGYLADGVQKDHSDYISLSTIKETENEYALWNILQTALFHPHNQYVFRLKRSELTAYLTANFLISTLENTSIEIYTPTDTLQLLIDSHTKFIAQDYEQVSTWFLFSLSEHKLRSIKGHPYVLLAIGSKTNFSSKDENKLNIPFLKSMKHHHFLLDFFLPRNSPYNCNLIIQSIIKNRKELENDAVQSLMCTIMYLIMKAAKNHEYVEITTHIVKSSKWNHNVRSLAVRACLYHTPEPMDQNADTSHPLYRIATHILNKDIPDRDYRLLGFMLDKMYPLYITIMKACGLITSITLEYGTYHNFCHQSFPQTVANDHINHLLDFLDKLHHKLNSQHSVNGQHNLFVRLDDKEYAHSLFLSWLAIVAEKMPGEKPAALFSWLPQVLDGYINAKTDPGKAIKEWLLEDPNVIQEFTLHQMQQRPKDAVQYMIALDMWLYRLDWPSHYGKWCLQQTCHIYESSLQNQRQEDIFWLISVLVRIVTQSIAHQDVSQEIIEERLEIYPEARAEFHRQCEIHMKKRSAYLEEIPESLTERTQRISDQKKEWFDAVKTHRDALMNDEGDFSLIVNLAKLYLGVCWSRLGDDPQSRLAEMLYNDQELIHAVNKALSGSLRRKDIISAEKLLGYAETSKVYTQDVYPALAGFDILYSYSQEYAKKDQHNYFHAINNDDIEIVLIALFTSMPLSHSVYCRQNNESHEWNPEWEKHLARQHPDVYSRVLCKTISSVVNKEASNFKYINKMLFLPEYSVILEKSWQNMLADFPLQCHSNRLPLLGEIIFCSLHLYKKRNDKSMHGQMLELINNKIKDESIDCTQKIYWLYVGFVVYRTTDENFFQYFSRHLKNYPERIRILVDFLTHAHRNSKAIYSQTKNAEDPFIPVMTALSVKQLELLIELMARYYEPFHWQTVDGEQFTLVTDGMRAAELINCLVHRLVKNPGNHPSDAKKSLKRLKKEKDYSAWHPLFSSALGHLTETKALAPAVDTGTNTDNTATMLELIRLSANKETEHEEYLFWSHLMNLFLSSDKNKNLGRLLERFVGRYIQTYLKCMGLSYATVRSNAEIKDSSSGRISGEIDFICEGEDYVLFLEVKTTLTYKKLDEYCRKSMKNLELIKEDFKEKRILRGIIALKAERGKQTGEPQCRCKNPVAYAHSKGLYAISIESVSCSHLHFLG